MKHNQTPMAGLGRETCWVGWKILTQGRSRPRDGDFAYYIVAAVAATILLQSQQLLL